MDFFKLSQQFREEERNYLFLGSIKKVLIHFRA